MQKNQMPKPIATKSATPPTTPPTITSTGVDEADHPVPEGVGVVELYTAVVLTFEVGDGLVETGVIEAEGTTRTEGPESDYGL